MFEASLIVSTRNMLVMIIDYLRVLNNSQFRDFPGILTKVETFTVRKSSPPKVRLQLENVMLSVCPLFGGTVMTSHHSSFES